MNYFIIIKSAGSIDTREFPTRLRERWPMARLEEVRNPKISDVLEFELPMSSTLYGSLDRQGKGVTFLGGLEDSAEFARWCRSLIPSSEEVAFCDESMSMDFLLKPSMTPADIVRAALSGSE
jgi:hypothetical protein